jgi:hypothetical protein
MRSSDRTVGRDGVPDGHRAMAERESITVVVAQTARTLTLAEILS